jgi:hypothetical protein
MERRPEDQSSKVNKDSGIKTMKRLIHDWWLGFQLLVRLVIACVCMVAGASVPAGLPIISAALHLPIPFYVFLLVDVLYVVLFCPFILASYARYCGFVSRTTETQAARP